MVWGLGWFRAEGLGFSIQGMLGFGAEGLGNFRLRACRQDVRHVVDIQWCGGNEPSWHDRVNLAPRWELPNRSRDVDSE